jgi:hypothetical protein
LTLSGLDARILGWFKMRFVSGRTRYASG